MNKKATKILGVVFVSLTLFFMFIKNTWDVKAIFSNEQIGSDLYFISQMLLFAVMFLGLKRLFRLEKLFFYFIAIDFFFNAAALNFLKEVLGFGQTRSNIEYICIGLSAIISYFQYRYNRKEFLK